MNHVENPNIVYQFSKDNIPCSQTLLDESWASSNTNFNRTLLEHPHYDLTELRKEDNLCILHELDIFCKDDEDLIFASILLDKISRNEQVTEYREAGFTPLLKIVHSALGKDKNVSLRLLTDV